MITRRTPRLVPALLLRGGRAPLAPLAGLAVLASLAALAVLGSSAGCGPVDDDDPVPVFGPAVVSFLVNDAPHVDADAYTAPALEGARYGDPFTVVVSGLTPGASVTLVGELYGMSSRAAFTVPAEGTIDLRRDAPNDDGGNTWSGVDAEGILWSMSGPSAGGPLDLDVEVRVLDAGGAELARGSLHRRFIDDGLVLEPVDTTGGGGRALGLLALPAGDGPFPAVLVFGGSEGGTGSGEFEAMYLASLGTAALGVGYFGAPGLPANLVDVPLELLEEDLALLANDPRIDPERIVVMGGSRGGELALLLGARFPVVHGVIAMVPSGLVWGGLTVEPNAAWTFAGEPLAYVPSSGALGDVDTDANGDDHIRLRSAFIDDIAAASAAELDAATIRVEDTNGPILLLAGDDDQLWPSCVLADVAMERLADRAFADESLCLPDAGHAIGMPGWSTIGSSESYRPDFGAFLVTGGTAQGNARASRTADTAIRAFLSRL